MTATEKANILIVDDRHENLLILEHLLESPELNIIKATSGNAALGLILEKEFALILLDVQMPDMDGFETAELIRMNKDSRHIPIIFVTAISKEPKYIFKGYEAGAVDYLSKPLEPEILKSKINVFLELHKQKKALEQTTRALSKTIEDLKGANIKILNQQKKLVEEERLKVLLQMAGATAHELNQPLMALLGNIEMMRIHQGDPEKTARYMNRLDESGRRIADIVKKIQTIRHDELKNYSGDASIINLNQMTQILAVENDDEAFHKLRSAVETTETQVFSRATTIHKAMEILKQSPIDLIFLRDTLPDGNGLDFMAAMESAALDIPVIVIADTVDEAAKTRILRAGACDYLKKEHISAKPISRIIKNTLEKSRLQKEVRTARKKMMDMTAKDELTGLYNRGHFLESLEQEKARAERYSSSLSMCILAVDNFQEISSTYGHLAGNMILYEIGSMLKESFRLSDLVCRCGDTTFAILLPNTDQAGANAIIDRFRENVYADEFEYNAFRFKITVSAGITSYDRKKNQSPDQLVAEAEEALEEAKECGKNKVKFFGSLH